MTRNCPHCNNEIQAKSIKTDIVEPANDIHQCPKCDGLFGQYQGTEYERKGDRYSGNRYPRATRL